MPLRLFSFFLILTCLHAACVNPGSNNTDDSRPKIEERPVISEIESPLLRAVLENAAEQTKITTGYSQEYFRIPYPNGDVPPETGACTDVIIRSFRSAGVDLQKEVHEDMAAAWGQYPKKWGNKGPDTNIDHRRVPNLQAFFIRKGKSLPVSPRPDDYEPGDVVSWDLDGSGMTHIGIVSNQLNATTKRYLIIHNIGSGTRAEDRLFEWKITGHFRYF